jgi:CheY-like chemotaxis protein
MITEVAAKRSSGPARYANLLIVEDETLSRIELAELLRYYGYKVSRARSGREAVAKVIKKNREIDAILMDNMAVTP